MSRDALIREARDHFGAQRLAEAEAAADRILALEPADFDGHYFKGFARLFANDPARALHHFDCAAVVTSGHPFLEGARGRALRTLGRLDEARECLERAVSINAEFGDAWMLLGETYVDLAEFELAERVFKKASVIAPFQGAAFARLSALREKAGDLETARAAARKAVEHMPDAGVSNVALAAILQDAGEHDEVIARIAPRIDQPDWSEIDRAEGYGLLAEAHEAKGEIEQAYALFEKANAAANRAFPVETEEQTHGFGAEDLRTLADAVAGAPAELWQADDAAAPGGPVFIIGFARSGTTLLDQILAAHPDIAVVEESGSLERAWLDNEGSFAPDALMARIATLTNAERDVVRADYAKALAKLAGEPPKPVVIDRYAMLLARAPLIRALWPNARFIFAQRDPRDAVLSAFQRRFAMTPATRALSSVSSAAAFYDASMSVFQNLREKAPCRLHTFNYENLLDDFEGELKGVLSFLGLSWDARLVDYRRHSAARPVRTASARQVIKPIYESSRGRWRAYEKQMADALPLLAPWAERFGYESGA